MNTFLGMRLLDYHYRDMPSYATKYNKSPLTSLLESKLKTSRARFLAYKSSTEKDSPINKIL
mgnify:FL=1